MKKIIILLLNLFLILASCSKDDGNIPNTSSIKPKKITIAETGEATYFMNYEYDGDLVKKITSSDGTLIIDINYSTNKKIANYRIQHLREPVPLVIYTADYDNNLLKGIINDKNTEKTYFYYNSNGNVIKTEEYSSPFPTILSTTFYEYDVSGNVMQSKDDYSTFQYTYDNANHPFKNVFMQLDAGGDIWPWFGSLINNQTIVKEKLNSGSTYITKFTYSYEYNTDNYVTKSIRKSPSGTVLGTVIYEY